MVNSCHQEQCYPRWITVWTCDRGGWWAWHPDTKSLVTKTNNWCVFQVNILLSHLSRQYDVYQSVGYCLKSYLSAPNSPSGNEKGESSGVRGIFVSLCIMWPSNYTIWLLYQFGFIANCIMFFMGALWSVMSQFHVLWIKHIPECIHPHREGCPSCQVTNMWQASVKMCFVCVCAHACLCACASVSFNSSH